MKISCLVIVYFLVNLCFVNSYGGNSDLVFREMQSPKIYYNLYCQSTNGVNLRESSTTQSSVIAKIGFGEKISVVGEKIHYDVINDLHGSWLKVEYKSDTGFVFSPYFGIYQIRKPFEYEELSDFVLSFLDGIVSDKIIHSFNNIENQYRGYSGIVNYNLYECGALSYVHFGYENENLTFVLDKIDPNQIYNLLKVYYEYGQHNSDSNIPVFENRPIPKDYPTLQKAHYETIDCMISCRQEDNRTKISIYYNDYPDNYRWTDIGNDFEIIDAVDLSKESIRKYGLKIIRYEFIRQNSFDYKLIACVNCNGNEFRSILPVRISKNIIDDISVVYEEMKSSDFEGIQNETNVVFPVFKVKDKRSDEHVFVYYDHGWKIIK